MAGSDYGCICFKNGVKIPMGEYGFMNMQDALGGYRCKRDSKNRYIDGNYRAYLGDKKLYIGVWKCWFDIFIGNHRVSTVYGTMEDWSLPYKKFRHTKVINGVTFNVKRIGDAQFKLRFHYKNDTYVVIYGYGVGDNVYEWWNNFLGLKSIESKEALKWYKHCKFV